jgi:hypothetical protein
MSQKRCAPRAPATAGAAGGYAPRAPAAAGAAGVFMAARQFGKSAAMRAALAEARVLPPPVQVRDIVAAVAEAFETSSVELLSERRQRALCQPRAAAMGLARELTLHSLPALGRLLHRDHTTVMHGARRHAEHLAQDPDYAARVSRARATLERSTEA